MSFFDYVKDKLSRQLSTEDESFGYVLIVALMVFMGMASLWNIDIGISAMVVNAQHGLSIMAGNGWLARAPCQQYHVGLYMNMTVIICFSVLVLYLVMKNLKLSKKLKQLKDRVS